MLKISFTAFIQKSNLLHIFSQQNFQSNYIVVQLEVMYFTLSCDFFQRVGKSKYFNVYQNLGGGGGPSSQTNFLPLNLYTTYPYGRRPTTAMLLIAPLIQEILSHSPGLILHFEFPQSKATDPKKAFVPPTIIANHFRPNLKFSLSFKSWLGSTYK